MKLNGKKITGVNTELLVIPRPNQIIEVEENGKKVKKSVSGNLVFKARAVLDFGPFEAICPLPLPPIITVPNEEPRRFTEDPGYKEKLSKRNLLQLQWMILESLKETKDLEWEKVDYSKPDTWVNYVDELKESGLNHIEIGRITNMCMSVNSLDQEKLDAALQSFLASQEAGSI